MTPRTGAERVLDGVVVRMTNYGESDRIVEFLTREEGRVSMIARGARRSKKRFGGALDVFSRLQIHSRPARNLWSLQSVEPINLHLPLRGDFDLLGRASLLCDCARLLTPEHHEAVDMHASLTSALSDLAAGDALGATRAYAEMLQAAGILPDAMQVDCRLNGTFALNFSSGFVVEAGTGGTLSRTFSSEVVLALRGESCSSKNAARQLEYLVVDWLQHHLGKRLPSADVYLSLLE